MVRSKASRGTSGWAQARVERRRSRALRALSLLVVGACSTPDPVNPELSSLGFRDPSRPGDVISFAGASQGGQVASQGGASQAGPGGGSTGGTAPSAGGMAGTPGAAGAAGGSAGASAGAAGMGEVGGSPMVGGVAPAMAFSAGTRHTCAIVGGALRCFGDATFGELGYNNTKRIGDGAGEMPPPDVLLGGKALQVAAGDDFTCAIVAGGAVRCWGNGGAQLGYGDGKTRGDDKDEMPTPDVQLGAKAAQVAVGLTHACAVLEGGIVRCWGSNPFGQLGIGSNEVIGDAPADMPPKAVDVGGVALQVAVGGDHSCALLEGGVVRCWGYNAEGQLGYGDTLHRGDEPGELPPPDVQLGGKAVQIAAGNGHSCALLEGGAVKCWGRGAALGLGSEGSVGDSPGEMPPPAVDVGGAAVQIASRVSHTCAVLADGTLRCWGSNQQGQLGDGSTTPRGAQPGQMPPPAVPTGGAVAKVTTGRRHTCALSTSGELRCWGSNEFGQLGIGPKASLGTQPGELPAPALSLGGAVDSLP